ncbi:MAG: hypothetical protein AAF533_27980 [Acidobacteriota bacterium]
MNDFLTAAALGIAALAVLMVVVGWVGRLLWRAAKKRIADFAIAGQPDTIELSPVITPAWKEPERVEAWTRQLLTDGFQPAGLYVVKELGGVALAGFVDPGRGLLASIAQHGKHLFVDFVAEDDDSRKVVNYTNAPETGLVDPTWKTTVTLTGEEPSIVHAAFVRDLPLSRRPIAVTEFKSLFEQHWKREIAWRKQRGGTVEEVDAITSRMSQAD